MCATYCAFTGNKNAQGDCDSSGQYYEMRSCVMEVNEELGVVCGG